MTPRSKISHALWLALAAGAMTPMMVGCGDSSPLPPIEDIPVELTFKAVVGAQDFACGQTYEGLGSSGTTVTPTDLRLYIHELSVLDEEGNATPVELDQASPFQHEDVALLDFEDGTGPCANGTVQTNVTVRGLVAPGSYTGVTFRLGVPVELNHADVALAPSPLNLSTMWWNWQGGYKFLRVDGTSPAVADGIKLHLGSTGCMMNDEGKVTGCANVNRPEVRLDGVSAAGGVVLVDLEALLAETDLETNTPETPSICLASPDDPDCAGFFKAVGLSGSPQTFFRAQ